MRSPYFEKKPCTEHCERCPTETFCCNLRDALCVAEKALTSPDSVQQEEGKKALAEVKATLEEMGWHFPHNTKDCDFQNANAEVFAQTEKLLKALSS